MFRIVIAARSRPLQVALHRLLSAEPGLTVVGQAGGVFDTLELIGRVEPDVVLVDLFLEHSAGLDLVGAVRHAAPDLIIVAAVDGSDPAGVEDALAAGASAWLDVSGGAAGELSAGLDLLLPPEAIVAFEGGDDDAGDPPSPNGPRSRSARQRPSATGCVNRPFRGPRASGWLHRRA